MKKIIYLLLLVTAISNAQQLRGVIFEEFRKAHQRVEFSKTIIDYGAIPYKSKVEALLGKESSHRAIQAMLDDVGVAILPAYGWFYIDDSVFLWNEGDAVTTLAQGNKGVKLVTDKPISMFLPINQFQEIRGFTAYYVGNKINKECAVVQIGGDERNKGGSMYNHHSKKTTKHFWKRRTRVNRLMLDFDFVGDSEYSVYSSYYPNKFKKNNGAHGLWIHFDEENEHDKSHVHSLTLRGDWRYVNTGIKIKRREKSQSMNTFDIDVTIWGARKFFDISDINFSKVFVRGQHQNMLGVNENVELYRLENSTQILADPFVYDVRGKRRGVFENVSDLKIVGLAGIHRYRQGKKHHLVNTDFINCLFKEEKEIKNYLKFAPKEIKKLLKKE